MDGLETETLLSSPQRASKKRKIDVRVHVYISVLFYVKCRKTDAHETYLASCYIHIQIVILFWTKR